jgi:hypothetical protein
MRRFSSTDSSGEKCQTSLRPFILDIALEHITLATSINPTLLPPLIHVRCNAMRMMCTHIHTRNAELSSKFIHSQFCLLWPFDLTLSLPLHGLKIAYEKKNISIFVMLCAFSNSIISRPSHSAQLSSPDMPNFCMIFELCNWNEKEK